MAFAVVNQHPAIAHEVQTLRHGAILPTPALRPTPAKCSPANRNEGLELEDMIAWANGDNLATAEDYHRKVVEMSITHADHSANYLAASDK